jgi:hypothetical protein
LKSCGTENLKPKSEHSGVVSDGCDGDGDGIQYDAIVLIATVNFGCGKKNHGLYGVERRTTGCTARSTTLRVVVECGAVQRVYGAQTLAVISSDNAQRVQTKIKLARGTLLARKTLRSTLTKS